MTDQRRKTNRNPARRRGVAMLLVLIAMAMAAVMAVTFVHAQATTTGIAENVRKQASARMIAESGLAVAIHYVQSHSAWRTTRNSGSWVSDQSFAGGSFSISASFNNKSSDPLTLTSTGRYGSVTQIISAVLTPNAGGAVRYGVAVAASVSLNGNASIDSYDSSRGPYGFNGAGKQALVVTNSTAGNIIHLTGSSHIHGQVRIGPGGNPLRAVSTSGIASVIGAVGTLAQPVSITAPQPGITTPATPPPIRQWGPASLGTTGTTTSHHFNKLRLNGSTHLTIRGNVSILVDGPVNIGGSVRISLASGASLTLYTRNRFSLSGNASINAAGDPSNFELIGLNAKPVKVSGSARLYGTVIAPNAHGSISGAGAIYGRFEGKSLSLSGSGALHQDLHAGMLNGTSSGAAYTVRWVEPS